MTMELVRVTLEGEGCKYEKVKNCLFVKENLESRRVVTESWAIDSSMSWHPGYPSIFHFREWQIIAQDEV